eukprot:495128-Ditylum_brightwellii.AAC.1
MLLCCRGHHVHIHWAGDIDEEGSLPLLVKDYQVWTVGRDGAVDPLSHAVHQSTSHTKTDRGGLVGLVLVPVGHNCAAFILEDTPMEVLAYLVMVLYIFGAMQHVAATGNMWDDEVGCHGLILGSAQGCFCFSSEPGFA